jgi:hypothetical protein
MVKRILKEPLLHFFLLGAGIFLLSAYFGDSDELAADEIVVTTGQLERLVESWKKTRMRPPTQAELEGLVDDYLREEIYYREALAMGLDSDDMIIRRRMRQKMEFISQDLSSLAEPTDEELKKYLQDNANAYMIEPVLSLRQVFLSRDRRGETIQDDARKILDTLQREPATDIGQLGDPLLLPQVIDQLSARDVSDMFGRDFTAQLLTLAPGNWLGPVESGYGLHLVLIETIVEARMPELTEVRSRVETDWRDEKRRSINDELYYGLKERYTIVVERPEWLDDNIELGLGTQE